MFFLQFGMRQVVIATADGIVVGDGSVFFTRPLSAALLVLAIVGVGVVAANRSLRKRETREAPPVQSPPLPGPDG